MGSHQSNLIEEGFNGCKYSYKMEDFNQQDHVNMTVRCILCRGRVIYKDGDITRFTSHLANEHGAFFDIEYLLASCFLDDSQKRAIADPVVSSQNPASVLMPQHQNQEIQETATNIASGDDAYINQRIKENVNVDPNRRYCDMCDKSYSRNEALKKHIIREHGPSSNQEPAKTEIDANDNDTDEFNLSESAVDESFDISSNNLTESLVMENGKNMNDNVKMVQIKSENLENKETSSSRKRNWECTLCGKVYNSQQGLYYHMKSRHSNGEEGENKVKDKEKERLNDAESPKQRKDVVNNYDKMVEQLLSEGIDLNNSAYFNKQRAVITNAGNTEAKFVDVLPFLPEGWKYRTYEANDKGKVVIHKNYLAPSKFVLKATMGVVEYLRLEGKMRPEEILEVAKNLRVGPSKLKRLFSNESNDDKNDDSTNKEETVAEA